MRRTCLKRKNGPVPPPPSTPATESQSGPRPSGKPPAIWHRLRSLYESAQRWDAAAALWRRHQAWQREAAALLEHARRLANQLEISAGDRAAAWQTAGDAWRDEGDADQAAACFREVARHLRQPIIHVNVAYETLIKDRYSTLDLALTNDGFGTGRYVTIKARGTQFAGELEQTQSLFNLRPGRTISQSLAVMPLHHGPAVPLQIEMEYRDREGKAHTFRRTLHVEVARSAEARSQRTLYNARLSSEQLALMGGEANPNAAEAAEPTTLIVSVSSRTVELQFGDETYGGPNRLDHEALLAAPGEGMSVYGRLLFAGLFHSTDNSGSWENATLTGYGHALRERRDLAIELRLDPNDPDPRIHSYFWETLRDRQGKPLAARQKTPFYRRVAANIRREKVVRGQLRILVMICNPPTLGEPGNSVLKELAKVDVVRERAALEPALRALEAAGQAQYTILERDSGAPATPHNLRELLSKTGPDAYHILHVLGHGLFVRDAYHLILEGDAPDEQHDFVTARTIQELVGDSALRLVILSTCLSARSGAGHVLRALGPEIVRAGVPAAIAMQDLLTFETARQFNRHFYGDLARTGRVDLALAATRAAIYAEDGPDSHTWGNSGPVHGWQRRAPVRHAARLKAVRKNAPLRQGWDRVSA